MVGLRGAYSESRRSTRPTAPSVESQGDHQNYQTSNFHNRCESCYSVAEKTWKGASDFTNRTQVFINMCLRRIFRIIWPDVISNKEQMKNRLRSKLNAGHGDGSGTRYKRYKMLSRSKRSTGSVEVRKIKNELADK